MPRTFTASLLCGLALMLGSSCTSTMSTFPANLSTVSRVDLDRYMGRWYVIAHTPNFLEKGKVGTSDNYARRPDGKLEANFAFHKETLDAPEKEWKGVATVEDPTTNASWKVQLFWPFWADYKILELDADYKWAVVASRGGKWLWILARDRALPDGLYREIEQKIAARGLDGIKLERVPQQK